MLLLESESSWSSHGQDIGGISRVFQRDGNVSFARARRLPGHLFFRGTRQMLPTQPLSLSQLLQLQYSLLSPCPVTLVGFDFSKYTFRVVDAEELQILHPLKSRVLLRFKLHFLS